MRMIALLALFTLGACGADAPPTTPGGLSVTGEARMGVTSGTPNN